MQILLALLHRQRAGEAGLGVNGYATDKRIGSYHLFIRSASVDTPLITDTPPHANTAGTPPSSTPA